MGDIMSTMRDILSTMGDIMINVGGYLEYCGGCSVPWVSWVPWGVTLSTVGDIMMHVGIDEYRRGKIFCYLNTPQYWTPPRYSNFKGWYPPRYWTPSTVIMISPHSTEHPHGIQVIPLQYSRYPPQYSWYPPMVLNTPTVLHIDYTGWFANLEKLENSNLAW